MADTKEREDTLQEEDLLEDEVIEYEQVRAGHTDSSDDFLSKYRNIGLGILGVAVVAVGSYLGYSYIQDEKQKEGLEQSIYAFQYFEADSIDRAIQGSAQYPGLQKIVDEYGGAPIGNSCKVLLGSAYYAKGDIQKGLDNFESFDREDNMVSVSALAGIAYGYEEKKDFRQAAEHYLKASETMNNQFTSPGFLQQAARCYEEAGDQEKAREIYQNIKRKYPNSEVGRNADKYIAKLAK